MIHEISFNDILSRPKKVRKIAVRLHLPKNLSLVVTLPTNHDFSVF